MKKVNKDNLESIDGLATEIGKIITTDGLLRMINSYMASHGLLETHVRLIPPVAGAKEQKWKLEYLFVPYKKENKEEKGNDRVKE